MVHSRGNSCQPKADAETKPTRRSCGAQGPRCCTRSTMPSAALWNARWQCRGSSAESSPSAAPKNHDASGGAGAVKSETQEGPTWPPSAKRCCRRRPANRSEARSGMACTRLRPRGRGRLRVPKTPGGGRVSPRRLRRGRPGRRGLRCASESAPKPLWLPVLGPLHGPPAHPRRGGPCAAGPAALLLWRPWTTWPNLCAAHHLQTELARVVVVAAAAAFIA